MLSLNLTDIQQNSYQVEIEENKSVADLKQMLADQHDADASKIRFIFNRRVIKDNEIISDLGWNSDSNIKVFMPKSKEPEISRSTTQPSDESKPSIEDTPSPAPSGEQPKASIVEVIETKEEIPKQTENTSTNSNISETVLANPNAVQARASLLEFGYPKEVIDIYVEYFAPYTHLSAERIISLVSSAISDSKYDNPELARKYINQISSIANAITGTGLQTTLGQQHYGNQFSRINSGFGYNQAEYEAMTSLKKQFEGLTKEQQLDVNELFISSKLSFNEVLQIYLACENDVVAARASLDL